MHRLALVYMYHSSTRFSLPNSLSFCFQICSLPNPHTFKSVHFKLLSLPNPLTSKSSGFQIRLLTNPFASKSVRMRNDLLHLHVMSQPHPAAAIYRRCMICYGSLADGEKSTLVASFPGLPSQMQPNTQYKLLSEGKLFASTICQKGQVNKA